MPCFWQKALMPEEMHENLRRVRDALPDTQLGREAPNRVGLEG